MTKILAFGYLFNGPDSYMRDYWNVIDFFIIIISVASASLPSVDLNVLKVIRLLRVLRPLKLISKNEGLKVSHYLVFNINIYRFQFKRCLKPFLTLLMFL
jgi:presenilin-like A22 family membrane protease